MLVIQTSRERNVPGQDMACVKALRIPGVLGKEQEAVCLDQSEQGLVKELTGINGGPFGHL